MKLLLLLLISITSYSQGYKLSSINGEPTKGAIYVDSCEVRIYTRVDNCNCTTTYIVSRSFKSDGDPTYHLYLPNSFVYLIVREGHKTVNGIQYNGGELVLVERRKKQGEKITVFKYLNP